MLTLYRLCARWIPRLPLRVSYALADMLGLLVWLLHSPTRRAVAHNQRRALGPQASNAGVQHSTRRVLQNLCRVYIDEFRLPALSAEELRDSVVIHDFHHFEKAHRQGKGVILTSAHYGVPQVVGQVLAVRGYPATVVVEHVQPEELFQFICDLRSSHGLTMLPIDKPLIGLLRTLKKEKGVVALVVDRDVSGTGIRLPFFGEETTVADGAVQLALRTGAPLVTAYCRRTHDLTYEAFVLPPLPLNDLDPKDPAAVRTGTARLMVHFEDFIRADPSQWLMTTPLWKI